MGKREILAMVLAIVEGFGLLFLAVFMGTMLMKILQHCNRVLITYQTGRLLPEIQCVKSENQYLICRRKYQVINQEKIRKCYQLDLNLKMVGWFFLIIGILFMVVFCIGRGQYLQYFTN